MRNSINAFLRFFRSLRRPSKARNLRLLHERGETLSSYIIREATVEDIPALAALHVQTWNDTYGKVSNPPSIALRIQQWEHQFKTTAEIWCCFIVVAPDGKLVGFAKCLHFTAPELKDFDGQLDKIYLLSDYQRLGLGKQLVRHVAQWFLQHGISSMLLFGTPQNPSCYFHESLGGKRCYEKNGYFSGNYFWKNIAPLAK